MYIIIHTCVTVESEGDMLLFIMACLSPCSEVYLRSLECAREREEEKSRKLGGTEGKVTWKKWQARSWAWGAGRWSPDVAGPGRTGQAGLESWIAR